MEGNAWNLRCVMGILALVVYLPHEGGRPLAHHPARHPAQCAHGEDREKSLVSSVTPSFWARDMRYKTENREFRGPRPQKTPGPSLFFPAIMPPKKQEEDIDCADSEIDLVFRETELKRGEGQYRQKNSGEDISCDQGAYHAAIPGYLHEKTPFLKDVLRESSGTHKIGNRKILRGHHGVGVCFIQDM